MKKMWAVSFFICAWTHLVQRYHERIQQHRTVSIHPAIHGVSLNEKKKLPEESMRGHMKMTAVCQCAKIPYLNLITRQGVLLSGWSCCDSPAQDGVTFHFPLHRIYSSLYSIHSSEVYIPVLRARPLHHLDI